MDLSDKPPIGPTPGDLMMVFRAALSELEKIKRDEARNFRKVWSTAYTCKVALDYWLYLVDREELVTVSTPAGKGEALQD